MFPTRQGKEIVLTMENRPGLLYEISKLLAERGVSILAVIGAVSDGACLVRLVTDDNLRAGDILAEKGHEPGEEHCILLELPHKPGILKRVSEVLAREEIDIHYVYGSALGQDDQCLLVLHTDNDERALAKLSQM